MKRFLLLVVLCTLIFGNEATATHQRSWSVAARSVMADQEFSRHVWAISTNADLTKACDMALLSLSQSTMQLIATSNTTMGTQQAGGGAATSVSTDVKMTSLANLYLENVKREVILTENDEYQVLCYMKVEDWQHRYDRLRERIENYISTASVSYNPEDVLRSYAWAKLLLDTYPNEDIVMSDGASARVALPSLIREVLDNITVEVVDIRQDKESEQFPYLVSLAFKYEDKPLSNITFDYHDGSAMVCGESIKDGRGMIAMKRLNDNIEIRIDCASKDIARQNEPMVYAVLGQTPIFDGSIKQIPSRPKGVKVARSEILSGEVAPSKALTEQIALEKAQEKEFHPIKPMDEDASPYLAIVNRVTASFMKHSTDDISPLFTPAAWADYKRIVKEGNPVAMRVPQWEFIKYDSLVLCRAIPLKLKFKGNKSFVEDVVFRIHCRTHKIESVAYKLALETETVIMNKRWDDRARLALLTFLEDYRTAYCLRNYQYIKKVFAKDAYIVVGRVLQKSKRKYADKQDLVVDGRAVYTQLSAEEYLQNLSKSFMAKEFINVRFTECTTEKGYESKEGIYAVQLRQFYYSNNYSDEGILTLAIDMKEEAHPLVRIRVWQQERDLSYRVDDMISRTVSTATGINAR